MMSYIQYDFSLSGQNRRLKMRLPVLTSKRRPSASKDQFEGVVVDYLQVRACINTHTHTHSHTYHAVL